MRSAVFTHPIEDTICQKSNTLDLLPRCQLLCHSWYADFNLQHHDDFYRIGEAKNPGPTHAFDQDGTACVYNPTGMINKHLFFLEHVVAGIS